MEPFIPITDLNDGYSPMLYILGSWMERYPRLTAGMTGRQGGVSTAPYSTLNLGLHVGDRLEDVIVNRENLADAVGIPLAAWSYGEQVHGCAVQRVERHHGGRGTRSRKDAFADKDAFITNSRGTCLAGLFADCVPLFFYDPEHEAAGLAHAGWKGTVLEVAVHTVHAMTEAYGSRPEALLAAIGPSIGACCYEVDDTVVSRFRGELNLSGEPYYTVAAEGKYRLNLQEVNRQIMIKAGIMPSRIEITKLCTGCGSDRFFSHRKENGRTGRMAAWIGLKP